MANSIGLSAWILSHAVELELKVEDCTWIGEFFSGLHDVALNFCSAVGDFSGFGFGDSADLGLSKAFAEVVERVVMREKRFETSNGVAAHLTHELAAQAAVGELKERDLFLCHYYSQTAFQRSFLKEESPLIANFKTWLSDHRVGLRLYELGDSGCLCLIDGRESSQPFGFVLGAAIKGGENDSILSATIEAGRRAHRLISGRDQITPLSLGEFVKLPEPSFRDHGRLALDLEYANQVAWIFEQGENWHRSARLQAIDAFEINAYRPEDPKLKDCPLYVVRAASPAVQNLFLGVPTREKINLERLSQFAGRRLEWSDVNPLPHPFD